MKRVVLGSQEPENNKPYRKGGSTFNQYIERRGLERDLNGLRCYYKDEVDPDEYPTFIHWMKARRAEQGDSSSVKASTDDSVDSRVVAIQLDVELPEGISAQDAVSFIEDAVANSTVQDFHIANIDICGDVTDRYEDNSDLLDLLVYR